jgi:hypothetical protein
MPSKKLDIVKNRSFEKLWWHKLIFWWFNSILLLIRVYLLFLKNILLLCLSLLSKYVLKFGRKTKSSRKLTLCLFLKMGSLN